MRESFKLEWRALVRGRALWAALVAVALAHLLAPSLVRGDGTAEGVREMGIRLAEGASLAVALLVSLASGCGLFAREREANRLGMTLVRPACAFAVVFGRWLALTCHAALLIGFSGALLLCRAEWAAVPCRHHFTPRLPSPMEVARLQIDRYLKDERTPDSVRKAPRGAVLQHLAMMENERYEVARPGETVSWDFGDFPGRDDPNAPSPVVGVRFAASYDLRTPVFGAFSFRRFAAGVTNCTQAVLEIPLLAAATNAGERLSFANRGVRDVMVRPRRDVELLLPADSFVWNAVRASAVMLSLAAFLAALGMFLSSALSKPTALFTGLSLVVVTLMSPSVVERYPDTFDANLIDKIGLSISRFIAGVTGGLSDVSPVADLAASRCVEWTLAVRTLSANGLLLSGILLACAALVIRRRPQT